MEVEELLAHVVEAWAAEMLPDELHAAAAAAEEAVCAYSRGASVSEACREARTLLTNWVGQSETADKEPGIASAGKRRGEGKPLEGSQERCAR